MRKINFLFGVLAVAATGLLSSCDWSDSEIDAEVKPEVSTPSLDGNSLVVNTNVPASITVNGETKAGQNATFAVSGDAAEVKVTAAGYTEQTVNVKFGENSMLSIDVQLVKESTNKVAQSVAKGTTVTNDTENQNSTSIDASIVVPEDVVISENTTDEFSVVAYTPAETGEQNVNVGSDVELPVLALSCTPSGAKFSSPVTLTASTKDAEGCEVVCVNGDESVTATATANSVSAEVDHFSVWNFVLKAEVVKMDESVEVKTGSILLAVGKNTITYTQKYGFEATGAQNGGLISSFLVNQFGKAGSITKSAEITSDKVGSADYTVKQAVKTYTFKSGNKTFTAKVYGTVTVTIDSTTPDTSGHSGGAGK